MNWKAQIDYFSLLDPEELRLFAPPREVERAVRSYNDILTLVYKGEFEAVLEPLAQIYGDYPLFAEASHLYAVCLALNNRYIEAEDVLKKLALLDLQEVEEKQVRLQLEVLSSEVRSLKQNTAREERRDKLLKPLRADFVLHHILQKAGDGDVEPMMASAKERDAILRNEASYNGPAPYLEEEWTRASRRRFILITVAVAMAVFVFFLFVVRPMIRNNQRERADLASRVSWLEQKLLERAPTQAELQTLYNEYQNWLQNRSSASSEEVKP